MEDPLSNELGAKIREIRLAEGLTQPELSQITDIPLDTIKGFESKSKQKKVTSGTLLKITKHPLFNKYALWLVTDQVNPEAGQISPEIKLSADQLKTG